MTRSMAVAEENRLEKAAIAETPPAGALAIRHEQLANNRHNSAEPTAALNDGWCGRSYLACHTDRRARSGPEGQRRRRQSIPIYNRAIGPCLSLRFGPRLGVVRKANYVG